LKQFGIFVFVLLMFVPPTQVHTDAIDIADTLENHLDIAHEKEYHKNDTDKNKKAKHHHHCSVESTVSSFIESKIQVYFYSYLSRKEIILFYDKMNSSSTIETPEEPPRI
jgi:hypothetical protein